MSSVQSFLRQRVVGTTTLSPPASGYYTFVAGDGNYVGNYPPGYMVSATTPDPLGSAVLRDMGKTIKARINDNGVFGTPGFFREVQVIIPTTVASATASSTFGVGVGVNTSGGVPGALPAAGNVGDAGYNTYYLPIVVGGVAPGTAATPSLPVAIPAANLLVGNVL
jgi:hypothetical protein